MPFFKGGKVGVMNKLKKQLQELHIITNQKEYRKHPIDNIKLHSIVVKVYSDEFIRIHSRYDVIDVDIIIDRNYYRYDIYDRNDFDFDGIKYIDREIPDKSVIDSIREYPDGLRIFTDRNGKIIFVDKVVLLRK